MYDHVYTAKQFLLNPILHNMLLNVKPLDGSVTVSHHFLASLSLHFPVLSGQLHVPALLNKMVFSDYFRALD